MPSPLLKHAAFSIKHGSELDSKFCGSAHGEPNVTSENNENRITLILVHFLTHTCKCSITFKPHMIQSTYEQVVLTHGNSCYTQLAYSNLEK